jgi:glycosyltransferase involved in cell wall biosynthesis
VIPVFNSEMSLGDLYSRLKSVLEQTSLEYEIIFVDDGSTDQSWNLLLELRNVGTHVVALKLARNMGQHNALLCGIREARFDRIVTIDDDLQNPPEEIPRLLAKLDDGFDVVYGSPAKQQHGILRNTASSITKLTLRKAIGGETANRLSAFRVFRTRLRDSFSNYNNPFVSIDVLLTWGTSKFSWIDVKHDARTTSTSGYTIRKLHVHAFNMVTGFTTLPLQVASLLGFLFAGFGFLALAYVSFRFAFMGTSVPGFTFLASTLTLFAGVQLLCLGFMGEYLARMHTSLTGRKPYTVEGCGAHALSLSSQRP